MTSTFWTKLTYRLNKGASIKPLLTLLRLDPVSGKWGSLKQTIQLNPGLLDKNGTALKDNRLIALSFG